MLAKRAALSSITVVITAVLVKNFRYLNSPRAPIVETTSGKVEGIISVSRDGQEFFEYLNIPYAKAPVGDLRFEPPEPPEKWVGVRDASEYGAKCLQVDLFLSSIEGHEDCLFLNVHSPKVNFNSSKRDLLPVMVWLHGGLFIFGSGNLYRPTFFMDSEDVVLVTVNYRLSSFGFLNTGDGIIRGNMGLKDQAMALRWIQENIEQFGGDPHLVTIFGESAGGASCHLHQMSKMSEGTFHKVITQSGLAVMPWALNSHPAEQALRFAEKLNCSRPNTKLMVACLKALSAADIITAHFETTDPLRDTISVFVPTIEVDIPDGKTFLADDPSKLLAAGTFTKVPLLSGIDSHEGLINSAVIFRNETLLNLIRTDWNKWMPRLLYLPDDTNPAILERLRLFYAKDKLDSESLSFSDFENITHMFSDRFWNTHFHHGIKEHVKHSTPEAPVYTYYYTYNSEFTLTDILLAIRGDFHPVAEVAGSFIRSWVSTTFLGEKVPRYGVCHGDEIHAMWYVSLPLMPSIPPGHADYKFSKEIVKAWIEFAKLSPSKDNNKLEFMGVKWMPQKANETLTYMKLDQDPAIISEPFDKRIEFWNSILTI